MKEIISPIKLARQRAEMTQEELATKIGTTQKDISRWENGERNPKIDKLKKIAEALDCIIDDLVIK